MTGSLLNGLPDFNKLEEYKTSDNQSDIPIIFYTFIYTKLISDDASDHLSNNINTERQHKYELFFHIS